MIDSVHRALALAGSRCPWQRSTTHCLRQKRAAACLQVLYGLPLLLTGSILAHEAMHAWLRLGGYRGLPPEVEEGMCQLMAELWLAQEAAKQQPVGVGNSATLLCCALLCACMLH